MHEISWDEKPAANFTDRQTDSNSYTEKESERKRIRVCLDN
jgi:hypothetical protein